MSFKASKKREVQPRQPSGVGSVLIPSAAIRSWYQQQMDSMISAMVKDYHERINIALSDAEVKRYFSEDASASSKLKKTLEELDKKWGHAFKGFAKSTSEKFTEKSDEHNKSSVQFSLSTAGIDRPELTYNENITNTLNAAQDFNHTLITGIQEEAHEKIYNAVMLSLTSQNPAEQGQSGIENALKDMGVFSKGRAKLIARDQTSKLYSSLSDERMSQNGIEDFEWMHSSAGKAPRQSHIDKDGKIFKINDPRLWEGKRADQGPPGWAINCRCRRRPII